MAQSESAAELLPMSAFDPKQTLALFSEARASH